MRIQLVCKTGNREIIEYCEKLKKELIDYGFYVICDCRDLKRGRGPLFDLNNLPDLVVIVGGDGTLLLAVSQMPIQVPVVLINYGTVGFLADLDPSHALEFIKNLTLPLNIWTRMRIDIKMSGKYVGSALNEMLIVTENPAKMIQFKIEIDGVTAERFRADGLIVSTPTGSTAYAMSAGGPIIDPVIEVFLMVPLSPFMLSSRPQIIDPYKSFRISLETNKPVKLILDGQMEVPIKPDDSIEILKSDMPVKFLYTGTNFLEKINQKLKKL